MALQRTLGLRLLLLMGFLVSTTVAFAQTPSPSPNPDISKTIIEEMGSQTDLLFTLSTAVFGGVIALFVQILIHNSEPGKKKIRFQAHSLVFVLVCLLLQGLSIGAAYFSRSAITALTPAIFRADTTTLKSWSHVQFEGRFALTLWPSLQFGGFFLGILALLVFLIMNRHLLRGD